MKSRRQRTVKAGTGKKRVPSDVSPSTSLPPLVEGQLRCFLRVTLSRVLWTVHKPPSTTFVRLRWWGESSNGTHFIPRDGSQQSQKTIKTTARFPIRCGPKQFTSYLTDMGSLVLEVLTKLDHLPIARAQVAGISRLSLSHPISGFYTLVSPTSEKLGELQVSLNLEALTEAYDSSSSGPTDISIEVPQVTTLTVPSQPRSLSAGSGKESAGGSSGNTPRGKDHLYFQNAQRNKEESLENQMPRTDRPQNSQTALNPSSQEPSGQASSDILSVILERGNKLRNAMVISALKCDTDSGPALKDTPLPLPKDNVLPPSKPFPPPPSGMFLQNILHADSALKRSDEAAVIPDCDFDCAADMDNRAVDLLLGSLNTSPLPLWDVEDSLPESLSGHSSVCGDSELNDPQYDQSLLENLFYKTPMSDIRPNDTEPSSDKQLTQSGPKISGGPNSEASEVYRHWWDSSWPEHRAADFAEFDPAGESERRLAGLYPTGSTTTPRKTLSKGKPPRPLTSKKCTYFIEYVFPVASTSSRHDHSNGWRWRAVKFQQHSVFPVHLNAATVKQWWGTDLTFKIYSRKSDQKKPVLIGESSSPTALSAAEPAAESQQHVEEDPEVLLHTLLMVPDGKNFSSGSSQAPNVYLNCKLFWCDEMARSVISWGQANPSFSFVQVTPVALTTKLLERMKNNVMVIEVWQKTGGGSGQDRLLGLVKLPLHQFYMSFRDPKIAHLLLQAQYPVLGVDCYMPVIDVFSGSCKGNLRVVLAMGRSEQIVSLQHTRDEEYDSLSHLVRPVHLLDHQPHAQTKVIVKFDFMFFCLFLSQVTACDNTLRLRHDGKPMREHLFVIKVEKVNGLTPLQSTVWGEADCYVQYSFPCQEGDPAAEVDQNLIETSVNLKPFRTTTTLCVPNPMFGHTETHVLLAPEGVPVQRLLLSSLSSQGLSSGGGVQFEVWCRYYYPNVRDQLVAKGLLPLSKLCAMVTMQRQQPDEAQMFSLPLIPRTGQSLRTSASSLRPVRPEGQSGTGAASRVVTLVVQVHRASGLQAAARVVSEKDERFRYFVGVGVNTYVTVQLSFLPVNDRRSTRISARSFCPEFDHHMERSSGETCSLAEQLEEASAVFTVWNKDNRKAVPTKDVMLGTVKIPLADLVHKRTGISGWFGVYKPQESNSPQRQQILVGGLEVSVNFAHHSDRERVIKAAQGVGWEMSQDEVEDDDDPCEKSMRKLSLTFSMPRVWLPVHCLLLPDHSELQRSTYCYVRYRFYDQDAFCSEMRHPSVVEGGEEGQATVSFQGSKSVLLRSTQPLMWYLREERLEVQVWVAFQKDKTQRPRDTDRLVGSAFVDLSPLAKTPKQKLTLSGVYPLFRRSATDLQGAALRVHITLTAGFVPAEDTHVDSDSQGELLSDEAEEADRAPSPSTPRNSQNRHKNKSRTTPDITSVQHTEMSADESFPVTVAVDRAMHLNLKEMERVIGFASVDLSPLLSGFQSVCGWYNITDFSGQCHGQLKVSITPLKGVQDLREQRKTVNEEAAKSSPPHTAASPLTSADTLSRRSRHLTTRTGCSLKVRVTVTVSTWTKYAFTIRVCRSKQQLTLSAAAGASDINPSSSILFSALRKKLSELDNIQKYFSRKLSTPTFPATSEQDFPNKCEQEQRDTDACQLLLKSNQLVGEVNNIISVSVSSQEDVILLSKISEDHTDSEPEEEKESEDENKEGTDEDEYGTTFRRDKEADDDDEEEDEDYEEVVTPDLVSLESLEAPEEPDLSQDEDEKRAVLNLQTCDSGEERDEEEDSDREEDRTATRCETSNSVPVDVPNFFLPSHQLEASMRAIRLAPSFSQMSSDPEQSSSVHSVPHRRGARLRPDMSPSSMKRETERIAKIFAAHFDDSQ
ncbi:C2 domain-containing protein 3 [Larimichthys crocea]|uniref:Uncharacterized protein n=1 Tax=Larimichthys crocea TaxID=215358 RepID=A0ACD3QLA1_LARCR|nr:C2 domain-containing protein 3 [Larimichthys crocea]